MKKIYTHENTILLKEMIKIYKPNDIDWMSYIITTKNSLTFHHINPKNKGGKTTIENGALLTKRAHRDLNIIEELDYALFQDWNELFEFIVKSNSPLDEYYKEESRKLKQYSKKLIYKK